MDIETVSEEIAHLFCPFATRKVDIGNLVNLKIEFAEYLMSVFTNSFKKQAEKYNVEGTMWFNFETDSEHVLTEGDLTSKLNKKFADTFGVIE